MKKVLPGGLSLKKVTEVYYPRVDDLHNGEGTDEMGHHLSGGVL